MKILTLIILLVFPIITKGQEVYFSPAKKGEIKIEDKIISLILSAKKSIHLQAYGFTSLPISDALINANKQNKCRLFLLVDETYKNAKAYKRIKKDSTVYKKIDTRRTSIAHNKIIIIDSSLVITGSYNFSKNAKDNNAENIVILTADSVVNKYLQNWHYRDSLNSVPPQKKKKKKK